MGKASNNSPLRGTRGRLGKIAVFKEVRGKTVTSNMPKEFKSNSPKQVVVKKTFSKASYYAKRQQQKPEVKALYQTGINAKKHSAYVVAMSDYLKAPEIEPVNKLGYTGAIGQQILIEATDDFNVTKVSVVIQDAAGAEIERGDATSNIDVLFQWVYTTTAVNPALAGSKIMVTAVDVAGNMTVRTETL